MTEDMATIKLTDLHKHTLMISFVERGLEPMFFAVAVKDQQVTLIHFSRDQVEQLLDWFALNAPHIKQQSLTTAVSDLERPGRY